jgi:hypothetical protein
MGLACTVQASLRTRLMLVLWVIAAICGRWRKLGVEYDRLYEGH